MPFRRTAYLSATRSSQPQRRGRPVVVPNSWPTSRMALAHLIEQLGRERPLADARGVGLGDADDVVDARGADAGAGAGGAGDRVASW